MESGDAGATPVDAGATPVEVEVGVSQPESACTQQAGGSTPVKPSRPLNPTTHHPPAKPAQPTRPPELFNGRLADGLSVRLFSTDGQRICPKPEPPDPNPPLIAATIHVNHSILDMNIIIKTNFTTYPTSTQIK
jgi:hypothetical protein